MTIAGAPSFRWAARHGWVERFADWDVGTTSRIEVRVECDDEAGGESWKNRRMLQAIDLVKPTPVWARPISQKPISHSSVWRHTSGASDLSQEKFVAGYSDLVIAWRIETVNKPAPGRQKRHAERRRLRCHFMDFRCLKLCMFGVKSALCFWIVLFQTLAIAPPRIATRKKQSLAPN